MQRTPFLKAMAICPRPPQFPVEEGNGSGQLLWKFCLAFGFCLPVFAAVIWPWILLSQVFHPLVGSWELICHPAQMKIWLLYMSWTSHCSCTRESWPHFPGDRNQWDKISDTKDLIGAREFWQSQQSQERFP